MIFRFSRHALRLPGRLMIKPPPLRSPLAVCLMANAPFFYSSVVDLILFLIKNG